MDSSPSCIVLREEAEQTIIDGRHDIYSVAVLADGKHLVSGGTEGKIRRWRIEDGKKVGKAMGVGRSVSTVVVSQDGKVLVGGTKNGLVTVWNAESHSKVTEFTRHRGYVRAVDVSPDATKIVTGSEDNTACIWSLSTGERLLDPLKHNDWVVATKFSPDGRLIATATCGTDSVRVYDTQKGNLLVDFPVKVNPVPNQNQSLAWAGDSNQFFALSHDGCIHHVDVSAKTTLSKWHIHNRDHGRCIALAGNGTFIAASARSSVSFWDTTSQEKIGTVIECTHDVCSMAISSSYDLVTSGDKKITLRALCDILPSYYLDNVSVPALKKPGNRKPV